MTHKTKGIVLRAVKYGETSLVVTLFTELFGIQSYIVNGVRTSGKTGGKASFFQPTAILEMVVYHNTQKNLQRIKEYRWSYLYQQVWGNVVKNSVALYMVELLHKCLKQPEGNTDLYQFCEEALLQLDKANTMVMANFPLFFSLHLSHFLGFRPEAILPNGEPVDDTGPVFFDLQEGGFLLQQPHHPHFIDGLAAQYIARLLRVMQPQELEHLHLNQALRRQLLLACQDFYALHISDFGQMRTLQVMQTVLGS
jgi:DNA repair protein RecO (recombination protein O)